MGDVRLPAIKIRERYATVCGFLVEKCLSAKTSGDLAYAEAVGYRQRGVRKLKRPREHEKEPSGPPFFSPFLLEEIDVRLQLSGVTLDTGHFGW